MRAQCIFVGRLTNEPELRYSQKGESAYVHFGIAVNKKINGEEVPNFYDCTAFNQVAENVCNYLHKGDYVVASGDINNVSYINKEGATVNTNNFIIYNCDFVGTKLKSETPAAGRGKPAAGRGKTAAGRGKTAANYNGDY